MRSQVSESKQGALAERCGVPPWQSQDGSPVNSQEAVNRSGGESVCDEQAVTLERPDGLPKECPMDGCESRAVGVAGDLSLGFLTVIAGCVVDLKLYIH